MFHFVSYDMLCSGRHSPYRFGTRCDICSVQLLTDDIYIATTYVPAMDGDEKGSDGIYHCDICKFDLCSDCFDLVAIFCMCKSCGKKDSIVMMTSDELKSSSFTCNKCKKAIKTGFGLRCKECGTMMCSECFRATAVCFCFQTYYINEIKSDR